MVAKCLKPYGVATMKTDWMHKLVAFSVNTHGLVKDVQDARKRSCLDNPGMLQLCKTPFVRNCQHIFWPMQSPRRWN